MSKAVTKKTRNKPAENIEEASDGRITIRLDAPMAERFQKVVDASRRSKTSVIEECLEKGLPDLERAISA